MNISTSPPISVNVLTAEKLRELGARIAAAFPDPIAAWMTEQGFNPSDGALLILPEAMRADPAFAGRDYVRFHELLSHPYLLAAVDRFT